MLTAAEHAAAAWQPWAARHPKLGPCAPKGAQAAEHAGGSTQQAQALLGWAATFSNWAGVAAAQGIYGWSNSLLTEPCTWDGVSCTGNLFDLDLSERNLTLGGPLWCNGQLEAQLQL